MNANSLAGKRVTLTKSRRERDEIRDALNESGAEVLELPLIQVERKREPQRNLEIFNGIATYQWVVFSSVNGVKFFFEAFFEAFNDIRAFGPASVACVGHQTAEEVARYHLEVELLPEESNGVALAKALVETGSLPSAYVLWVSGDKVNRDALKVLEGEGEAILDVFEVYQSSARSIEGEAAAADFRERGSDVIFFASPSAVESFVQQVEHLTISGEGAHPKTVSIGPSTSEAMKRLHVPVDRECQSPEPHVVTATIKELVLEL